MYPPKGKSFFLFLMKILFIYSKLEEGWTITKLDDGKFEFKRFIDGDEDIINSNMR